MKITLLTVGKTIDSRLEALIDEYRERLKHYIPFDFKVVSLSKSQQSASLSVERQKQIEGELILAACNLSPLANNHSPLTLILLDEHGKEFRSIEFADYLQKRMSAGKDLVFVVGGPYGFSKDVYDRADGLISLSKMTFSHQMIRLLFTEQLYRAMTILRNEPYHHE